MNFKVVCLNFIYITTIFDLKLLVDLDVDAEGVMDVREKSAYPWNSPMSKCDDDSEDL